MHITIIVKQVYKYISQVSVYRTIGPLVSSPEPKAHSIPMLRPSFTFSKIFSSETAWPIKAELHVEHDASLGWNNESLYKWSRSHDQDGRHGYKIAKTFKNLFLQNQMACDFETWHKASGNGALQNLYKS